MIYTPEQDIGILNIFTRESPASLKSHAQIGFL